MSERRDVRTVRVLTVDSAKMAEALCLDKSRVEKRFKDGRTASPWIEEQAFKIFRVKGAESSCQRGFDAAAGEGCEQAKIEIRCLTESGGVKFQKSIRQGGHRDKDKDGKSLTKLVKKNQLRADVGRVEAFIVGDVTEFPIIKFTQVSSGFVQKLIADKKVTPSGIKKDSFYKSLREEDEEGVASVDVKEIKVVLS